MDKTPPTMLFSIIMPAYNEADVIFTTVTELCTYLDSTAYLYELVIIDDASTDQTANIVKKLAQQFPAIVYRQNSAPNGYGYAIRNGLEAYSGDAAVIVTSDGADAPKDVEQFFSLISEGYDCAFGDRFDGMATVTG